MAMDQQESHNEHMISEMTSAFNQSEFAKLLGMQIIEASDGYARVMDCCGEKNKNNVAHGGAVFALADQAFGIAANCGSTDRFAVSIHIQYIAPATGSLIAIAQCIGDNGIHPCFGSFVYEGERIIAEFDGVAIQVPKAGSAIPE